MFKKASKKQSKLRLALFGPSGAGKTFTALRIAKGLGGKVAVIDTERGSASKYADRFDFDVAELTVPKIDNYCNIINSANEYSVLIIDSLSHGWSELLEEVDKIARSKYKGNTWSAWSEGNPKQKKLVNAILGFNGHVIATMRSKTEWTTEATTNGKSRPVRVGLSPEQGKGIEYEFDMLIELSTEHVGNVIKDRTGKFQDELIEKPDEDFGNKLIEWLNDGEVVKKEKIRPEPEKENSNNDSGNDKTTEFLVNFVAMSETDFVEEGVSGEKYAKTVQFLNKCLENAGKKDVFGKTIDGNKTNIQNLRALQVAIKEHLLKG